ncbi:N-acetylmannosamine kinase [Lactococcus hodotermopsidis]|uniref:N-acetylmannosamine kinase n=1 Tax=Pseudolactococcus hodotermopsidis TaxID=2709157 RepID=A0A6A0BFC9_9LACT|nr:ROK family protein [Lactococcus hodotermopsidis]GFH43413.1 N-acetylmannosamine kinase [Lactococcus hodotermopsidis]
MALLTIDVGGTTIKFASFENGKLSNKGAKNTPETLEAFYQIMGEIKAEITAHVAVTGVAMSCPGAVSKVDGVIYGASAIPYIHNFSIKTALEGIFKLPVTMENDANCAALAEVAYGAGKDYNDLLFFVIGTGIGGSVVLNKKIRHGAHLMGGEFGFMLMQDCTLSNDSSPVRMAKDYNELHGTDYDGQEIFALAENGDKAAEVGVARLFDSLARAIFNLQYALDPEIVLLGGGISQADFLIPKLQAALQVVYDKVEIATIMPKIAICHFQNDANLIGAAADFLAEN